VNAPSTNASISTSRFQSPVVTDTLFRTIGSCGCGSRCPTDLHSPQLAGCARFGLDRWRLGPSQGIWCDRAGPDPSSISRSFDEQAIRYDSQIQGLVIE